MNFDKLKEIGNSNTPLVFIPTKNKLYNEFYDDLHQRNIDFFCPEGKHDINSVMGINKIQMMCDAVVVPPDYEGKAIDLAEDIGQPVFYLYREDIDLLYNNIMQTIKYPQQFMMMRLLHSAMYFLHVDKNKDYSPSNILGTGQAGIATRLWDKAARFMNLIGFDITTGEYSAEKEPKNESILDTLIDLSNYSLIGIVHRFGMWGR